LFSGWYVIYRVSSFKGALYIQATAETELFMNKKMNAAQISKPKVER